MWSGRLFEDFFPVSDSIALVTTGKKLDALDRIETVGYSVRGSKVEIGERLAVLTHGTGLRLGGLFNGRLVYSEIGKGIVGEPNNAPASAHQPFVKDGSVYYTDGWPQVRIYRNGEVFLDHFNDMEQVGNPCWVGDSMYFEARADDDPRRPDLWEIWRYDGNLDFVCMGANPSYWNGRLFVGEWNGRNFDYRCATID
jgi:hypothetical protein